MASVDEPENAKCDDQESRRDLDLSLPFDEADQQREGEHHCKHRQQMADGEWPKRRNDFVRAPFHKSRRDGERPSHRRVHPMIETAYNNRCPEPDECPIHAFQVQTDG